MRRRKVLSWWLLGCWLRRLWCVVRSMQVPPSEVALGGFLMQVPPSRVAQGGFLAQFGFYFVVGDFVRYCCCQ